MKSRDHYRFCTHLYIIWNITILTIAFYIFQSHDASTVPHFSQGSTTRHVHSGGQTLQIKSLPTQRLSKDSQRSDLHEEDQIQSDQMLTGTSSHDVPSQNVLTQQNLESQLSLEQKDLSQRLSEHIDRHNRYNQQQYTTQTITTSNSSASVLDGPHENQYKEAHRLVPQHQNQQQQISDHDKIQRQLLQQKQLSNSESQLQSDLQRHSSDHIITTHIDGSDSQHSVTPPVEYASSPGSHVRHSVDSQVSECSINSVHQTTVHYTLHEEQFSSESTPQPPQQMVASNNCNPLQSHQDEYPRQVPRILSRNKRPYKSSPQHSNLEISIEPAAKVAHLQCKSCAQIFINQISLDQHCCFADIDVGLNTSFPPMSSTKSSPFELPSFGDNDNSDIGRRGNSSDHEVLTEEGALLKQCDSCDQFYKDQECLDAHIKRDHSHQMDRYRCLVCDETFMSRAILQTHQRVEHPDSASDTDASSPSTTQGNRHVKEVNAILIQGSKPRGSPLLTSIVTSDGRHLCDICNKSYRSRSILRTHRITHGNDKPYICETCKQGFNSFSNLRNHRFKHTGRKFPCEHCGKSYSSPGNLKTHLIKLHGL